MSVGRSALIRLAGGTWDGERFELNAASRPIEPGGAFLVVFENHVFPASKADAEIAGAAIGRQLGELLAGFAERAIAAGIEVHSGDERPKLDA